MREWRSCWSVFLIVSSLSLSTVSGQLGAQTKTPTEIMLAASDLTALDQVTQKPWHLKLEVTVFDDKGLNPQDGTVEVWRSGEDVRTLEVFGAAKSTVLVTGGKTYRSSVGPEVPFRAADVLQHVLHPGPSSGEVTNSTPELRKQSFGKVNLDCIMLSQPVKSLSVIPLGLFPTYCIAPDSGLIRASLDFGAEGIDVNSVGKFFDRKVVTNISLSEGKVVVAKAKVASLSSYTPEPDEFNVPADAKANAGFAKIAGGVIAGNILTKVAPVYPESAKEAHVSGRVVLRAIIGKDGHVHSLRPVTSFDPDLAVAAIAAVRQWRYKPYLLNGEPSEVDTTITVNFNLY